MPATPSPIKIQEPKIEQPKPKESNLTDKAESVGRVAKRLGWVTTDDPDEAIKILSKEAENMKENVYKYLESLATLAKNFCTVDNPKCINCPMNQGCKYRSTLKNEKRGFFRR